MITIGALLILIFIIGILLMLKGIRAGANEDKMKKGFGYFYASQTVQVGAGLAVFSFVMTAAWLAGL